MNVALVDTPATPFRIPPGVRLVKIDQNNGLLPGPNTTSTILEAFKPGTEPARDTSTSPVIFGAGDVIDPKALEGIAQAGPDQPPAPEVPPPPPMTPSSGGENLGGLY
jgi:penicillin-binding protein 1A